MTTSNSSSPFLFHTPSLLKHALIGALIAFALMAFFISGVDEPHPDWPTYWMLRPLLVVSVAGAIGGAFFSLMKPLRQKPDWSGFAAYFVCFLVYVIGLWMGSVVGLDGTLWD